MGEANIWQPRSIAVVDGETKRIEERLIAIDNQKIFSLSSFAYVPSTGALEVHKNGLIMSKGTDWIELTDTTFSFEVPLMAGDVIIATGLIAISGTVNNTVLVTEQITLTAGQTTVLFTNVLLPAVSIYVAGLSVDRGRLISGLDYTVIDTTSIKLSSSYPAGTTLNATSGESNPTAIVTDVFGRTGNVAAASGDYTASKITNVPSGNISATEQQAVNAELDATITANTGSIVTNAASIATLQVDNPNNQTGTAYTLALTDKNKTIWMNNAAANTLTIPENATTAFPIDTVILVMMEGVGVTTLTALPAIKLNGVLGGSGDLTQFNGVTLVKRAADVWVATPLTVA